MIGGGPAQSQKLVMVDWKSEIGVRVDPTRFSCLDLDPARTIALPISGNAIAQIVLRMRGTRGKDAYVATDPANRRVVLHHRFRWTPRDHWKEFMASVAEENGDELDVVEVFTSSLFVKRSKKLFTVFVVSHKCQSGTWTDVTLSGTDVAHGIFRASNNEIVEMEKGKSCCWVCKKENCVLRCGRCRRVFYCGVKCQKKHWSEHKHHCV